MLADTCEAAVRAARPTSKEQIEEIIRKVMDSKLLAGELDECDLTLRDLEQTREAFVDTLSGVFHPRVQFPEDQTATPSESDQEEMEMGPEGGTEEGTAVESVEGERENPL